MTEIVKDVVETKLLINGQEWHVGEVKVELSLAGTPNYVDMNTIIPKPETLANFPDDITDLINTPLRLEADTELIAERNVDTQRQSQEEKKLLFEGRLANISSKGDGSFEGIAYDSSQQAFNTDDSGSLINQHINIPIPEYSFEDEYVPIPGYQSGARGTIYRPRIIKTRELIQRIVNLANIPEEKVQIELGPEDEGITRSGPNGSYTGAYNRTLFFDGESNPTVEEALEKARQQSQSEMWFDNSGVFHFGLPRPTNYRLKYITNSSAGITTPPYQSVRVIGSGLASESGWSSTAVNAEDRIVVEASIARGSNNDQQGDGPSFVPEFNETREPVFTYRNAEISSYVQARSTVRKLIEDLGKQQASGKVTVVGFPEILPLDAVTMPNTDRQPMGGTSYSVYKVVHNLSGSNGFTTDIHVSGVVGVTVPFLDPDTQPNTGVEYSYSDLTLLTQTG